MRGVALAAFAAASAGLCGCDRLGTGPDLVSAQTPPGTGVVNNQSEPQPPGSLPPGAAVYGPGPGATQRSYLSLPFRTR